MRLASILACAGCAWWSACAAPPPPCPCAANAPGGAQKATAPMACPSASNTGPSVAMEAPEPEPQTCGQFALLEARLVASGKGDNHPRLLAVRARLEQCPSRAPTAAECAQVLIQGGELAASYGPKHPLRVANDAERALCASPADAPQTGKKPPAKQPPDEEPKLPAPYSPPTCGASTAACGYGPNAACCAKGETCCAGGAAGHYYCRKGKGPCPALP